MFRLPLIRLAMSCGIITALAGCENPSSPVRRKESTPVPVDTTGRTPSPKPASLHLLSLGAAYLGMEPLGSATHFSPPVMVVDGDGRPVANIAVDFAITSGGGSLSHPQSRSDASGVATPGAWTLGMAPGANVVRATSATVSDTVYFEVEAVVVDTSRPDGRFLLDRIDRSSIPTIVPEGVFGHGQELSSATVDIRGSRFVFTWTVRSPGGSADVTHRVEGSVTAAAPYLIFEMDGTDPREYFKTSPAMLLKDGRLRIANFAEGWPLFGVYQDFRRAP